MSSEDSTTSTTRSGPTPMSRCGPKCSPLEVARARICSPTTAPRRGTWRHAALELARAAGHEPTLASCLLAHHDAIWEPGSEEARLGLATELAELGRTLRDPAVEAQGLLLATVAELELGDPTFRHTHRRFDAIAEASRSPRLRFRAASRAEGRSRCWTRASAWRSRRSMLRATSAAASARPMPSASGATSDGRSLATQATPRRSSSSHRCCARRAIRTGCCMRHSSRPTPVTSNEPNAGLPR